MRTVPGHVPTYARCGHCSLPDSLHTQEQRARCEKRLLAELSRSWPRKVQTQAERDAHAAKKVGIAIEAVSEALKHVELSDDERGLVLAAVDVLGAHLVRRTRRVA